MRQTYGEGPDKDLRWKYLYREYDYVNVYNSECTEYFTMKNFYMHMVLLFCPFYTINKQTCGIQVILTLVPSAVYSSVNPPPGPWLHHLLSGSLSGCNVENVGVWSERTKM